MEYFIGLLLVILAGIGTGAGAWPFKVAKDMRLEIYLLVWVLLSLVVAPWAVTFFTVSDVAGVARSVGWKPLIIANALSCSWGIANVLYMICVLKIGAALTGAILGAVAMAVGMILPLVGKAAMGGSGSPGAGPAPTLWKNLVFFSVMLMVTLLTGVLAFYSKWLRRREDHSPFPLVTAILLGLTLAILIAFTTGSLRL